MQVYRFRDSVAINVLGGETIYLDTYAAREIAFALTNVADDIDEYPDSYDSPLGTFTIDLNAEDDAA